MHEKKLIKNTMILAFGQLVPKLLSILILPILTNQFSETEYGQYDLALTLSSMMLPILTLQIYLAVFRELLSEKNVKKKSVIISTSLMFLIINSLIVSIMVGVFLVYTGVEIVSTIVIMSSIVGEAIYTLSGQIVRGLDSNIRFSVGTIVYSVVNSLFICVLLITHSVTVVAVIIGISIAYFMASIYMLYKSREVICCNFKFEKKILINLLRFSIPIIPSTISLWVVNMSDRLLISCFLGISLNGIYSVATKIPNLYNTAYGIFNMAWIESASRAEDSGEAEEYYSVLFGKLFDFLTGFILLIISVLPILYYILIDKKFYSSYNQSVILILGAYINSFVSFYGGIYLALRKTTKSAISSVIGAMINVAINLLFINKIGLYAASLSTAISFLTIVIYRAIDINKYVKIRYSLKEILFGVIIVILGSIMVFEQNIIMNISVFLIACLYNKRNLYLFKNIINKVGGRNK